MRDLVKNLGEVQELIEGSAVRLRFDDGRIEVETPHENYSFRAVDLDRPSAAEVKANVAADALLILRNPSAKAVAQARNSNYIVLPEGGFRIVTPGLVLWREAPIAKQQVSQVRLRGASGVVTETLLLGAEREWSVNELASESQVSVALAHRVLKRLETEAVIRTFGSGPGTMRRVINANALSQIWRDEEAAPQIVARGYLYGATLGAVIARAAEICPQGAMGGVIAANTCEPTLTNLPAPVRFWAPFDFSLAAFEEAGLELTDDGANIEIAVSRSDAWKTHRTLVNGLPTVSCWRAWMEVGEARGRIGELAEKLLHKLQKEKSPWK